MRSFWAAVRRSRSSLRTMNTNRPMPAALTRIMGDDDVLDQLERLVERPRHEQVEAHEDGLGEDGEQHGRPDRGDARA